MRVGKSLQLTAFGETLANDTNNDYNFFTGKPEIAGLGYAFLFRSYRPELGKWQTQDPLGYPDGWNNLAYVNNNIVNAIDYLGATTIMIVDPITGAIGSISYSMRIEYEEIFLTSNSGTTGAGESLTITVSSNISYSTSQSDTVTFGYSGGLVITGSVESTSSTTVTNGASGSLTIGELTTGIISLYQKKAKVYYDYSYFAPTLPEDPIPPPSTGSYYAGSYMTSMYVTTINTNKTE